MHGEGSCLELFLDGLWWWLRDLFAEAGLLEGVGVLQQRKKGRGLRWPEDRIIVDSDFLCLVDYVGEEV